MDDKNNTAKDSEKEEPVSDFSEPEKKSVKDTPSIEKKDETINLEREKTVVMGQLDSYITERMKSQPKTVDDLLSVKELRHPSKHRLSLPKELKSYTKEFRFRWIMKDKRAIDESIYKGWVLVNRALFPNLPPHLFCVSGGIEEGDLILGCISLKLAEARIKAAQKKSTEMVTSQVRRHETRPEYYKPTLSKEEEENVEAGDLQEGRDF